MRFFRLAAGVMVLTIALGAQGGARPSASGVPAAKKVSVKLDGSLAEVMRGILFPNSNLLFDVQTNDPGTPPKKADGDGDKPSDTYAGVYSGWQVVEAAAVAIEESADVILKAGRSCSNGKAAPVTRADYIRFAGALKAAGRKTLLAAREKNQEKVSDSTNDLDEACSNCHQVYRDKGPAGSPARCVP